MKHIQHIRQRLPSFLSVIKHFLDKKMIPVTFEDINCLMVENFAF